MEIIGFEAHQYVAADIPLERCDTIIDLKSGYYELNYAFDDYTKIKLCQVAKFNNTDGTILIAITGYYADEQCSNYPSRFYEISKSGDRFIPIELETVLPFLNFSTFFTDLKPTQILEKYLPEMRDKYLGSNAEIANAIDEVYDYHIIIPRKGTTAKVMLTVCDYIPRNQVNIDRNDWSIIEDHIKAMKYIYDKNQKQFRIIPDQEQRQFRQN